MDWMTGRTAIAFGLTLTAALMLTGVGCKDKKQEDAAKSSKRTDEQLEAMTNEAVLNLDKIYKSAAAYYTTPRMAQGTGLKIDCQFPDNQKMTPDVTGKKCCGGALDADNDNRCDVDTSQWTSRTWSALNFQMNDQHHFGYAFESSGTLTAARFTASAYADLDCDGELSTFQRFGYGDVPESDGDCVVKGASLTKRNELE